MKKSVPVRFPSDFQISTVTKQIFRFGDGSKPWYLVNPKIAGKWMFIPLKNGMYRYWSIAISTQISQTFDARRCGPGSFHLLAADGTEITDLDAGISGDFPWGIYWWFPENLHGFHVFFMGIYWLWMEMFGDTGCLKEKTMISQYEHVRHVQAHNENNMKIWFTFPNTCYHCPPIYLTGYLTGG